MAIIYGLKVNLSVAMVVMVNQTATKEVHNSSGGGLRENECPADPPKAGVNATNEVSWYLKFFYHFNHSRVNLSNKKFTHLSHEARKFMWACGWWENLL